MIRVTAFLKHFKLYSQRWIYDETYNALARGPPNNTASPGEAAQLCGSGTVPLQRGVGEESREAHLQAAASAEPAASNANTGWKAWGSHMASWRKAAL